jgi:hypothetical protein
MLENSKARLETKNTDSDSVLVLGKKLENPYSGLQLPKRARYQIDCFKSTKKVQISIKMAFSDN